MGKLYNQGQPGLPPLMPNLPMDLFANQEKALNLHVEQENEKLKEEKREEEREEQKRRDDQLKERLAALDQTREKERELKDRLAELDRDQHDHQGGGGWQDLHGGLHGNKWHIVFWSSVRQA